MKIEINIKNIGQIETDNCVIYDYLDYNIKKGNLKKGETNLSNDRIKLLADEYNEFLKIIINKCDRIILCRYPESEINFYKNNLQCSSCNILTDEELYYLENDCYLFDISAQEDKDFFSNNLKYNLEEYEDDGPFYHLHVKKIDINRYYVANDENYDHREYMFFLLNDSVIAGFRRRDGVTKDYVNLIDENCINHKKTR